MEVCIGGDFCITQDILSPPLVSTEVVSLFSNADYRILNLECPVTESLNTRIPKTGPHLQGSIACLNVAKQLGINIFTLANNHIMDYGVKGFSDSLAACVNYDLQIVGAGMCLDLASKPLFIESGECRLAIVNFAENEWASADIEEPGANPYDLIECSKQITRASEQSDHVLVVIHGGHEYYNLPSPRMKKDYRFFAESGASAVISHHSHTISGFEIYGGVPIFYGLGNFLFTRKSSYASWYSGLCLRLSFPPRDRVEFEIFPVTQSLNDYSIRLANDTERSTVLSQIDQLNTVIADDLILKKYWDEFVLSRSRYYLNMANPLNTTWFQLGFRVLHKLGLEALLLHDKDALRLLNTIRCESHIDIFKASLRSRLK